MSEPGSLANESIERLEKLPVDQRRAAFFAELDSLALYSRARTDLNVLGRRRFAPGPYDDGEFKVIAGFVYPPRRPYTEEETRLFAEHAAAMEVLEEAHTRYVAAIVATRRAKSARGPENAAGHSPQTAAQDEAVRVAVEAERDAREDFDAAAALEVRARPHQRRPLPAAGRLGLLAKIREAVAG